MAYPASDEDLDIEESVTKIIEYKPFVETVLLNGLDFEEWISVSTSADPLFSQFKFQDLYKWNDVTRSVPDAIRTSRRKVKQEIAKVDSTAIANAGVTNLDAVEKDVKLCKNFSLFSNSLYGKLMKQISEDRKRELHRLTVGKQYPGLIAWAWVKGLYEKTSAVFFASMFKKLEGIKLDAYKGNLRMMLSDMDHWITILEATNANVFSVDARIIRLKQAFAKGKDVSENDPYHQVFVQLVSVANELDATGNNKVTWEYVKTQCMSHYISIYEPKLMSNSSKDTKDESLNFTFDAKDPKAALKNIQKIMNDPNVSKKNRGQVKALFSNFKGSKDGSIVCFNCGKQGHKSPECRSAKVSKGGKGKGKGGKGKGGKGKSKNGKGGKGKSITCHNCHKVGHMAKDCWSTKPNNNAQANVAQAGNTYNLVSQVVISTALITNHNTNDDYYTYIDSCASRHMTGDMSDLTNTKSSSGQVLWGDSHSALAITAEGLRGMKMLDSKGSVHTINFNGTICVPGLKKKLLSMRLLVEKGLTFNFAKMMMTLPAQKDAPNKYVSFPLEWIDGLLAVKQHF